MKGSDAWRATCEHELVPLPLFAMLLYMLEFAIDRYYNPKTGRSEKPDGNQGCDTFERLFFVIFVGVSLPTLIGAFDLAARKHSDNCENCGKGGQLLCCEKCPLVYHMHCLDPPLHHIPRGAWVSCFGVVALMRVLLTLCELSCLSFADTNDGVRVFLQRCVLNATRNELVAAHYVILSGRILLTILLRCAYVEMEKIVSVGVCWHVFPD